MIGAGATGAGCALEAELRGLHTVLIDAGDFASATSSASTKLVHGGIRYLEQAARHLDLGQLKVVRQALHERVRMLANAPHLAHSRRFLIPCFSRLETWYYGLGVQLYDWLAGSDNLAPSHSLSAQETLQLLPELNPANIAGSITYADGQFDDARYCLALVESLSQSGGCAANYLKVISFDTKADGRITSVVVEDQLTHEQFSLTARVILNATGPFSEMIRDLASRQVKPRLVLSRGVHILLPLTPENDSVGLLIPHTEDGRVIFAIPWMGRLLVGTTDQEVTNQAESFVTRREAEYLLRHLNKYLRVPRSLHEIVSAFSGVRPLVRPAHAKATKQLIRDHELESDSRSGLLSILGGKWTTYRAMAEDAVNSVQQRLGVPISNSRSLHHPLAGAAQYTSQYAGELSSRHNLPLPQAAHLAGKFGTAADDVCVIVQRDPSSRRLIVEGFPAIEAEIAYSIRNEMAMTLEDVLARRIGLQFHSWELSGTAAPVVAQYFVREHGWSPQRAKECVDEYLDRLDRMKRALMVEAT